MRLTSSDAPAICTGVCLRAVCAISLSGIADINIRRSAIDSALRLHLHAPLALYLVKKLWSLVEMKYLPPWSVQLTLLEKYSFSRMLPRMLYGL